MGDEAAPPRPWALVPVKDLDHAKQRLAPCLGAGERRCLAEAMLQDVLDSLVGCPRIAGCVVVTRDPGASGIAAARGIEVLPEPANRGQSAAVARGAEALASRGVDTMLAIPGDLPLVTPEEIEALLARHGAAPAVTIATDRAARGSNAVVCSPPTAIPFAFGDESFRPHLRAARERGIVPRTHASLALALDVDRPEDLLAFAASPSETRAYRYLLSAGVIGRLFPTTPLRVGHG